MKVWMIIIAIVLIIAITVPISIILYLFLLDKRQDQHAVLRNFPLLGRFRYIAEKLVQNYGNIYSTMMKKASPLIVNRLNLLVKQVNTIRD